MNITRLEKFLINRNLLKAFNINRKIYSTMSDVRFLNEFITNQNAIYMAFNWFNTPEGIHFWSGVSAEWKHCLRNNTL